MQCGLSSSRYGFNAHPINIHCTIYTGTTPAKIIVHVYAQYSHYITAEYNYSIKLN